MREYMERGLSLLFRLMSASWLFIGSTGCEKKERAQRVVVLEEFDAEEEHLFSEKE